MLLLFICFFKITVGEVNFPKDNSNLYIKMLVSLPFADQMEGLTKVHKNTHKLELAPEIFAK